MKLYETSIQIELFGLKSAKTAKTEVLFNINQPLKGKAKASESSESATTAESTKKVEPVSDLTNTYWLQVGAYASKGEAETQKAALAMQGMQATISEFLTNCYQPIFSSVDRKINWEKIVEVTAKVIGIGVTIMVAYFAFRLMGEMWATLIKNW